MKILKSILWILGIFLSLCVLTVGFLWLYLPQAEFTFSRHVKYGALVYPLHLLRMSEACIGTEEGSDAHHAIIDTYNTHEPLAQGYEVKYDDDWCATFVSFAAIKAGVEWLIPTECSCQRQIGLWQELGRWEENDSYLPLPGDIIYYDWDVRTLGDSTGWADHVGIVVGTHGPFIKVIEGNKDDSVGYRYIIRWDPRIRGYGLPNYGAEPQDRNANVTISPDAYTAVIDSTSCDIDGDGTDEVCILSYGPTSGLFTFILTVRDTNGAIYSSTFCTEYYYLSFEENAYGAVQVRGETQDENPAVHHFDISIENGYVVLSENGELLPYWGS